MASKYRRPAQLSDERMESIQGEHDVAYNAELANTSAWALVPVKSPFEDSETVRARVLDLVRTEGIDVIAESWVKSPEDSLPGILWRGYLLYEWVRRFPEDVRRRYEAACHALETQGADGKQKIELTPSPEDIELGWKQVFEGLNNGDITELLKKSARFTNTVAEVDPSWIGEDNHPLATDVTRRNTALLATSQEFYAAAEKSAHQILD